VSLERVKRVAAGQNLDVIAAFHPNKSDFAPDGCATMVLLGPREPGFWAAISREPEAHGADPVDRWSRRIIEALAEGLDARALFPFGGPPYQPFVNWALASGQVWQSPVSLLVHDRAGLFVSFRGALAFDRRLDLPDIAARSPCETCDEKPCLSACPPRALTSQGYDIGACHGFLDQAGGRSCLDAGCLVRKACPVSQTYGRLDQQSAHHMRYFHKKANS